MIKTTRAAHARNLIGPLIRSTYRITVHDVDSVPASGAVVLVCDWPNIAAPTVVKAALGRPVHVWAAGPAALPGPLLSVTGDLAVPEGRPGVRVLRDAVRYLDEGEAVAVCGVDDVGYAIAVTGAPVQTIMIDAPATKRPTDPPSRKASITVQVGPLRYLPERLHSSQPTRNEVRAVNEWVRQLTTDARPGRFEVTG
ncbi:MAG TPA: hypothetical protein VGP37_09660 [Candidatus Nanopelagicales bacterium]|nr:hypothetical protein [Candidatus Nanopelagicales bacterium]